MSAATAGMRARVAQRFEDLLPHSEDPAQDVSRGKLVDLLNAQGEIAPPATTPLGRLWRLVGAPDVPMDACEDALKLDAGLSARLLRVANSAAYHADSSDVAEALRFLGPKAVREMVYNAGVLGRFSSMKLPEHWDVFWLRNIFVARLCDRIASAYFPTDGSEYLAGLIHDVGWLFLAAYFPEEFAVILSGDASAGDAEKRLLPFTHANVAAAIAARSGMRLQAIDGIMYHHKQMLMTQSTLVAPNQNPLFLGIILGVCDRIADGCQLDLFGRPAPTERQLAETTEIVWLRNFGPKLDLAEMAAEELVKAEEIYTAYFAESAAA